LRGPREKSVQFPCPIKDLPHLLVLRGVEQDSTEMAEEIGAGDAEFLLREIPRQLREGGREHQRQDAACDSLAFSRRRWMRRAMK
jgi:hypothetical protein